MARLVARVKANGQTSGQGKGKVSLIAGVKLMARVKGKGQTSSEGKGKRAD